MQAKRWVKAGMIAALLAMPVAVVAVEVVSTSLFLSGEWVHARVTARLSSLAADCEQAWRVRVPGPGLTEDGNRAEIWCRDDVVHKKSWPLSMEFILLYALSLAVLEHLVWRWIQKQVGESCARWFSGWLAAFRLRRRTRPPSSPPFSRREKGLEPSECGMRA